MSGGPKEDSPPPEEQKKETTTEVGAVVDEYTAFKDVPECYRNGYKPSKFELAQVFIGLRPCKYKAMWEHRGRIKKDLKVGDVCQDARLLEDGAPETAYDEGTVSLYGLMEKSNRPLVLICVPFLVDLMDDNFNAGYDAVPERLFVIENNKFSYVGGCGPFQFLPEELKEYLTNRFKPTLENPEEQEADHFRKVVDAFFTYRPYSIDWADHMEEYFREKLTHYQRIDVEQHMDLTPDPRNIDKVKSTLKQFAREWSTEGQRERDLTFLPILEKLEAIWPNKEDRASIRVYCPGAGLGRICLEVY
eukprot:gene12155-14223_t